MNIHKLIFVLLTFVVTSLSVEGQTQQAMIFSMRGGETATFPLNDDPKILFDGDSLIVSTKLYEMTYDIKNVLRYYFATVDFSGISSPSVENVSNDGHTLSINIGKAGVNAYVYSSDGKIVLSVPTDRQGIARISLDRLSKGICIVKCNNFSTKILKR